MAGHSKWKNIQHRKGRQDALRGKIFAKLSREITVAARSGSDPETNQRLRLAVAKARSNNMPNDNVERAIKKGSGEDGGGNYESIMYEGYGPSGVAVMVEALTDNRNRTAADVRHIFSKRGGNLGEAGCVAWMFARKGLLVMDREESERNEDDMLLLALEAGAEDVEVTPESFQVITAPEVFEEVKVALESEGENCSTAEVTMIPENTVELTGDSIDKMLALIDALEDNDDVQNVYANFEADDADLANYQSS
ncbi:YebC/PmpR family DNA-binding transcriptional regulator [Marininema halotolerans]|uniref:Probable transcriptional regulatory protein SAMN05444972_10418 n=1 Tax=Marininema halotolerans TaxID=1155944 RepID=A0A1I6R150_9BACL|nr:YebC/PmpR family DNA-binding transcriptional regulator [Marininema halotolerans]SFS58451.1 DNA-binding regulatory protein, YebC/PmpR family [Marininema halotolerans]